MNVQYNNIAGRLLAFFQETPKKPDNTQSAIAWCEIFGIKKDPKQQGINDLRPEQVLAIQDRLSEVYREVVALETEVQERFDPQRANFMLKNVPNIKRALATNIGGAWGNVKGLLTETTLHSLEHCAIELPKEEEVKPDELETCKKIVSDLMRDIKNGKIKNPLRKWLLALLSSVSRSIDLYWIGGARHFRDALNMLTGEIVWTASQFRDNKDDPETQSVLNRVKALCQTVFSLASKYKDVRPLIQDATEARGFLEDMFSKGS